MGGCGVGWVIGGCVVGSTRWSWAWAWWPYGTPWGSGPGLALGDGGSVVRGRLVDGHGDRRFLVGSCSSSRLDSSSRLVSSSWLGSSCRLDGLCVVLCW